MSGAVEDWVKHDVLLMPAVVEVNGGGALGDVLAVDRGVRDGRWDFMIGHYFKAPHKSIIYKLGWSLRLDQVQHGPKVSF